VFVNLVWVGLDKKLRKVFTKCDDFSFFHSELCLHQGSDFFETLPSWRSQKIMRSDCRSFIALDLF